MRARIAYQAVESVIGECMAANAELFGDGELSDGTTSSTTKKTALSTALKLVCPGRQGSPESQGEHPAGVNETFSVMEDLWLRLNACTQLAMDVDLEGDGVDKVLRCRLIHGTVDEDMHGLLRRASESYTYAWSQEGRLGSFVSFIDWVQGELVIGLTPISQIRRWPDGEGVCWQLQALLHRLQARAVRSTNQAMELNIAGPGT